MGLGTQPPGRIEGHGFLDEPLLAGSHLCQIYENERERDETVLKFIVTALRRGSRTFCVTGRTYDQVLAEYLGDHGISLATVLASGQLRVELNRDFYLKDGVVDAANLVNQWNTLLANERPGSTDLWAMGDVLPQMNCLRGGTQFAIYESKLNEILWHRPVAVICQYHAERFDGQDILGVLKLHPLALIQGQVKANPFYDPPSRLKSH